MIKYSIKNIQHHQRMVGYWHPSKVYFITQHNWERRKQVHKNFLSDSNCKNCIHCSLTGLVNVHESPGDLVLAEFHGIQILKPEDLFPPGKDCLIWIFPRWPAYVTHNVRCCIICHKRCQYHLAIWIVDNYKSKASPSSYSDIEKNGTFHFCFSVFINFEQMNEWTLDY